MKCSVVILTRDEAVNIADCIASCAGVDDVHVLDSGSTDDTVRIATELGARVATRAFDSFARQRNWALEQLRCRHPWVFFLDADERMTPELLNEIDALPSDPEVDGYQVASKLMFMGRWLRRAGDFPVYQVRLVRRDTLRFRDVGHGQREGEGYRIGRLHSAYLHFNFSKGLDDWFERHNRYSSLEAEQALSSAAFEAFTNNLRPQALLDRAARRHLLKQISARVPLRGTLFFWYIVLVKGAVLDGPAGVRYAKLRAIYEDMTRLKLLERRAGVTGGADRSA